jgi:ketosteroid isomerase-like protein
MFIRIAATALLSLVTLPALAQPAVSEATAQQAAVQNAQTYAAAYNAGKPADVAALFTADGVLLSATGAMLTDHPAMTALYQARQQAGWTQETIKVLQAHPEGSDVWAVISFEFQGTGAKAGKHLSGYAAELLTREGGSWRFKVLAANLTPQHDVTGVAAPTAK